MSSLSRWTYTNTATVYPFEGEDLYNGGTLFGTPYEIACTWETGGKMLRDASGDEFVSRMVIYTEDPRPKARDQIVLNGQTDRADLRDVTEWDLSFFGEPGSPDFKLVT